MSLIEIEKYFNLFFFDKDLKFVFVIEAKRMNPQKGFICRIKLKCKKDKNYKQYLIKRISLKIIFDFFTFYQNFVKF
ncbi:hypothetical protein BpHYR1_019857 [Brachionus plicatilis]|uniref:Uncharacterized protein n=1 Tax=Brachionus plicatilis TaxID=10195 RepID=A0A3M7R2X7_BRAPC|nr:hypothetical protein BpHYR1_019857 [Brachionus plicatilis]